MCIGFGFGADFKCKTLIINLLIPDCNLRANIVFANIVDNTQDKEKWEVGLLSNQSQW